MNTELTRRYTQPATVSAATALHYRQYKNSTSVASSLGSIPDSHDLLAMKTDLEGILPNSEKRLKYLQCDMFYIKKHVKIRDIRKSVLVPFLTGILSRFFFKNLKMQENRRERQIVQ
jgi:hypothetical protein